MNNHQNTVELIGHYGNDQIIACSAWTSTSRDLAEDKIQRIPKLLKMLADEGHHTPFEKSGVHFLVNSDIASHIHKLKHRVAVSINGESARYKEIKEDKYLIPDDWKNIEVTNNLDINSRVNFPGKNWADVLEMYTQAGNRLYHAAIKDLEPVLGRKRAKESARYFKTYNSQIQADIMFNWRSFYHFLSLRNKPDAQKEIREIAAEMLRLVQNIEGEPFKHTRAALS